MKRTLLLLLGVLLAIPSFSRNFTYTYDGKTVNYTIIDEEAKTCATASGFVTSGKLNLPAHPKDGLTEYSLIKIDVFGSCPNLTEITIPETVTSIVRDALTKCENLSIVNFNAENCTESGFYRPEWLGNPDAAFSSFPPSITKVNFGKNVKIIPDQAFFGCKNLKSITIPESVEKIGMIAFGWCAELKTIYYNAKNCTSCGGYTGGFWSTYYQAFPKDIIENVYIGKDVESLPDNIFSQHTSIKSIDLSTSSKLTSIGISAFSGCKNLTSITLPKTLKTIGKSAFYQCEGLSTINLPNSLEVIGETAFCACTGLTDLTLPNSLTTIGERAFSGCTGITNLTLPNNSIDSFGNLVFEKCTGLTEITIPESLNTLGGMAFSECDNLKTVHFNAIKMIGFNKLSPFPTTIEKITFGDKVTLIPEYLLYGCNKITSVTLPNSLLEIRPYAFNNCSGISNINFGKSLETIWDYAFSNCTGLKYIDFGNSLDYIGSYAFSNCSNLKSINLGNVVNYICNYAFSNTAIENITFPSTISYIHEGSFYNTNIKELTLPENIKWIDARAFANCGNLKTLRLGKNIKEIGERAFDGCNLTEVYYHASSPIAGPTNIFSWNAYNNSTLYVPEEAVEKCKRITPWSNFSEIENYKIMGGVDIENLTYSLKSDGTVEVKASENFDETNLVIPSSISVDNVTYSVTSIADKAFGRCYKLKSVKIPNSVISIGESAFSYCTELESVEIPNSVTSIGDFAFEACYKLESVEIPNSVISIGYASFMYCNSLKSVTISESVIEIDSWAFAFTNLSSINVPSSVKSINSTCVNGCRNLVSINVDASNSHYISIDGILFSKDKSTLIKFPPAKDLVYYSIPTSVEIIDYYAFNYCSKLESIIIPESVTKIEYQAFAHTNLSSINIPSSVESINGTFVNGCQNLVLINVDASNSHFTSIDGILYNKDKQTLIRVPQGKDLTQFLIPTSVEILDEYAFYNCTNLGSIIIPESVSKIKIEAFWGCTGLNSISIPGTIEEIGNYAFYDCTVKNWVNGEYKTVKVIESVYYAATDPISASKNLFDDENYELGTLYVPEEAVEKCKIIEPWKYFANIKAYDFNSVEAIEDDADINNDEPCKVYNLNGIFMGTSTENLAPGIYIVRQGNKVEKISVQ